MVVAGRMVGALETARAWAMVLVAGSAAACSTADLKPAPVRPTEECTVTSVAYCDAGPPGSAGCAAATEAESAVVRGLPRDVVYPVGCLASALEREQNECGVNASCRCVEAGDASVAWSCPAR